MIVFVPINPYIKKEDVLLEYKKLNIIRGSVLLVFITFLIVIRTMMVQEILDKYETFNLKIPFALKYEVLLTPLLCVSMLILVIYLFFRKPNTDIVSEKLKKYKPKEMISRSELFSFKTESKSLLLIVPILLWFIFMIIIPITELSNFLG